jgi:hypothetical protein
MTGATQSAPDRSRSGADTRAAPGSKEHPGPQTQDVVVKGGRLRGERLHEASAERSSSWAIGEARGHCPLHNHASSNQHTTADVPNASGSSRLRGWSAPDPVLPSASVFTILAGGGAGVLRGAPWGAVLALAAVALTLPYLGPLARDLVAAATRRAAKQFARVTRTASWLR